MSRKVKIFLGAYANIINAQNINCLSTAKNLDKSKFDITILAHFAQKQKLKALIYSNVIGHIRY